MSQAAFEEPIGDSVARVNDEIAVGEDLDFQRRWWKFERTVWVLFSLLILGDLAGIFGRGPLANASYSNPSMDVHYEKIERSGTPSMMHVYLKSAAIQDGKIRLFVSNSVVDRLGAQRIIPAPESSVVGDGGLTYIFPSNRVPASVTFALEPASAGITRFTLQVPGFEPLQSAIYVVP